MNVAILGSGPAGLLAALAVEQSGGTAYIITQSPEPSPMFGAMYLHRAIPEVTDDEPDFQIDVVKVGTREGYARNVYGSPDADVSWDNIESGFNDAWDLPAAYEKLHVRFKPAFNIALINPDSLAVVVDRFEMVMSTIPLNHLCIREHEFDSQPIWISHGPSHSAISEVTWGNLMYYNGYDDEQSYNWYRYSLIRGYQAWEYSHKPRWWDEDARLPGSERSTGVKPLSNTCDCWPQVKRLGRFGTWRKGVLTHHAYQEALNAMHAVL